MIQSIISSLVVLMTASFLQAQDVSIEKLTYAGEDYELYPAELTEKPDIPSPLTAADGMEYIITITKDSCYTIIPVTVENGEALNYKENLWYNKGRQLDVDSLDFQTLAATGLHSEGELDQTKTITGRSVDEITRIARPEQYSGLGFIASDEDILSVLKGDNELVSRLDFTHPELAKPLFHVFNTIQRVMKVLGLNDRGDTWAVLYNDRVINLKFWGAKGWQESIFDDEILGYWEIEMWRELDSNELAFLSDQYSDLSEADRSKLMKQLSYIHTGEMVPFYIMRYGFYEGHTGYRADPIAVASMFGLRTIEEIDSVFPEGLHSVLSKHH